MNENSSEISIWSNLKIHRNTSDIGFARSSNGLKNATFPNIKKSTSGYIEDLSDSIIKSMEKLSIQTSGSPNATVKSKLESEDRRQTWNYIYQTKIDSNFKFINSMNSLKNEKFSYKPSSKRVKLPKIQTFNYNNYKLSQTNKREYSTQRKRKS